MGIMRIGVYRRRPPSIHLEYINMHQQPGHEGSARRPIFIKTLSLKTISLGLAIAAAVVAAPVIAGDDGHHRGRHGFGGPDVHMLSERMIGKLSRKLDLDDAQREALFAAADATRPAARDMRRQFREFHAAMHDLDPKAPDYAAAAAELAKQHGTMASAMTLLVADLKAIMAEVLSTAQMEKFQAMWQRRHHPS